MRNLKVFIAYNGAAYHGFQRQDNAMTVQEAVENSIGKLLKIPAPVIYGCSRTDTGVHARQFCFNVHVDSRIPCEGFVNMYTSSRIPFRGTFFCRTLRTTTPIRSTLIR